RRTSGAGHRQLVGPQGSRRMIYLVDGLLWVIAILLGLIAVSRSRTVFRDSVAEGAMDCVRLIPRVMLGVIGSGYIAALLPQDVMGHWFGADSGVAGIIIAAVAGSLTPGGPVV